MCYEHILVAKYKLLIKSKYILNIRLVVSKLCTRKYKRTYVASCLD